jgi:hypothetical protein
MRVHVHPAGRHQQSTRIHHRAADSLSRQVRSDGRDPRAGYADIRQRIKVLARVDNPTATDNEIKHVSA